MVSLNFSQNQSEGDPDLSTTENEDANTTQVNSTEGGVYKLLLRCAYNPGN